MRYSLSAPGAPRHAFFLHRCVTAIHALAGRRAPRMTTWSFPTIFRCVWRPKLCVCLNAAGPARALFGCSRRSSAAARVRLSLDSTAEAIYALDLHGRCTMCNRAGVRMSWGIAAADELVGQHMNTLAHYQRKSRPMPIAIEERRHLSRRRTRRRRACRGRGLLAQRWQSSPAEDLVYWAPRPGGRLSVPSSPSSTLPASAGRRRAASQRRKPGFARSLSTTRKPCRRRSWRSHLGFASELGVSRDGRTRL